jgi:hypothetical protein
VHRQPIGHGMLDAREAQYIGARQPSPEAGNVVVLELAHSREKTPPAPSPLTQATVKDRHDFQPYQL